MSSQGKIADEPGFLASIEKVYRLAVAEKPYCSISVKYLCEQAGVTRKAFYKRFNGKGDVLCAIIERDVVKPQLELIEILSFDKMKSHAPTMEQHMFQAICDDGAFYRDVVNAEQGGRGAFLRACNGVFKDFNTNMLVEYGFRGEPWQADYAARYFASAKAHYLLCWISDGFKVSVDEASKLYARMALPFWNSLS